LKADVELDGGWGKDEGRRRQRVISLRLRHSLDGGWVMLIGDSVGGVSTVVTLASLS